VKVTNNSLIAITKKKKNENIIQILHRDMHYSKNIKEKTNASPEAMNAEA
jgi:hypothetical protein